MAKYTGFGRGYTGFSYHVTGGHEAGKPKRLSGGSHPTGSGC